MLDTQFDPGASARFCLKLEPSRNPRNEAKLASFPGSPGMRISINQSNFIYVSLVCIHNQPSKAYETQSLYIK